MRSIWQLLPLFNYSVLVSYTVHFYHLCTLEISQQSTPFLKLLFNVSICVISGRQANKRGRVKLTWAENRRVFSKN